MQTDYSKRIYKYLKIIPGDTTSYEALAAFHYRDRSLGPVADIFAMIDEHPRRQPFVPAVGVIVYRPPVPNLAIRNHVTGGFFSGLDRASGLGLLNAHVRCISRVIIDPRYRNLGLASRLVRETLPRVDAAMVEASAVMGHCHPFFRKGGMQQWDAPLSVKTERMMAALETVGIDRTGWIDSEAVHDRIEHLDEVKREFIERQIEAFLQKFGDRRTMTHSLQRTDFVLSKLGDPGCYYTWLNPDKPVPGLHLQTAPPDFADYTD